jgi:hypothetical protein
MASASLVIGNTKLTVEEVRLARRFLIQTEECLRDKHQKTSHLRPLWEAWFMCFEVMAV